MPWLEASIVTPAQHRREIENLITAMGGSIAVKTGGLSGETTITAYFPADTHAGDTLRLLHARIRHVLGSSPDINFSEVKQADPKASQLDTRFKIGDSLVVKPPWEDYQPDQGEVVIDQDPAVTAAYVQHPTTILVLTLIDQFLPSGGRVIDVGTGTGILAVAAAKMGASDVLALDVDPADIEKARETVAQNHLEGRVTILEGRLPLSLPQCDLMLANIYPHLLEEVIPAAFSTIAPGGHLIVTGFTAEEEGLVAGLLRGNGFEIRKLAVRGQWVAVVARRPLHE